MATKFEQFLKDNSISERRLLAASHRLESLKPEDRALRLKARQGKGDDKPAKAAEGDDEGAEAKAAKRRSGRPVTPLLLRKVAAGNRVSGAAKTRVLRAVNHVLSQKKKDPVDLRALF